MGDFHAGKNNQEILIIYVENKKRKCPVPALQGRGIFMKLRPSP